MEKPNKLNTKDLINVGMYTAIYFAIAFIVSMINAIPVLFIVPALIVPIIDGIPFMLFLTKVKKFGMLLIMSVIIALIEFIFGYGWMGVTVCLASGLIAELILKAGKYTNAKSATWAFTVFGIWQIASLIPLWVMGDTYIDSLRESMGDQFADGIQVYTSYWVIFAVLAMLVVGGLIGGSLGRKVLRKHFEKAGIA